MYGLKPVPFTEALPCTEASTFKMWPDPEVYGQGPLLIHSLQPGNELLSQVLS